MAGTESRHHLSGEESGRPDGNEHASDGMPSVAQVPTPGNHFLDDGQRDAMAMPKLTRGTKLQRTRTGSENSQAGDIVATIPEWSHRLAPRPLSGTAS